MPGRKADCQFAVPPGGAPPGRSEVVGYATFWADGVLLGSVPVRAEAAQAVPLSAIQPATP